MIFNSIITWLGIIINIIQFDNIDKEGKYIIIIGTDHKKLKRVKIHRIHTVGKTV